MLLVVMLISVRIGTMKSERLNVAVAPEVKALWQSWADKKGMSLSNFIRHCVNVCVSAYEKQERSREK